jgi:hypothetical protein
MRERGKGRNWKTKQREIEERGKIESEIKKKHRNNDNKLK